jgi:hypothetical protein
MPRSSNRLEIEISEARRSISTDGYPISISELTNLYREGELNIRPEFQRFFRWTPVQKSRLVESLLLGIPIPSIFVAQAEDGIWELVDGLQRISTILELQGLLRDSKKILLPQLELHGTKYLPDLEGKQWEHSDPKRSLSNAQRLDIKRAKLDVKIIKRESSSATKYDLFQRLNSYGMSFTAQEMRSALLIGISSEFFSAVEGLSSNPAFRESVALTDRLLTEQYDLELVLRWLVLHDLPDSTLTQRALRDFPQFLDDSSISMAESWPASLRKRTPTFNQTFETILAAGAEDVFRRWDRERQEFRGPFLNTAFEVFALGLGYHIANGRRPPKDLLRIVKRFWEQPNMRQGFATGRSTEARLSEFVPMGRRLLASPPDSPTAKA